MVEAAGRAVAPEPGRVEVDAGLGQQPAELGQMVRGHPLLDAVGTEARDLPTHVEPGLVERIAEVAAAVAADHEVARLPHEGAHVADRALHHDRDALHRDAAARGGVAVDDEHAAAARGAGTLRAVAGDMDPARHHVLGHARAGMAVDGDASPPCSCRRNRSRHGRRSRSRPAARRRPRCCGRPWGGAP